MFTTAVDKLLSQFFALSAEERSCILEVPKQEARCQSFGASGLPTLRFTEGREKRQT